MRRCLVVACLLAAAPRPARAYDFEVAARTIAQGYQLRSFRLLGADLILSRRRFTQALRLVIHDIGDWEAHRRREHRSERGPVASFTTYLRLDHDFGDWTMGAAHRGDRTVDAIDAIPELASSALALDVLYAYASIDGVAGGAVDLRIGRQVAFDRFDMWAWDGGSARVHTPWHVAVSAAGGLRVRDASPVAPAAYELDGTTGAECREYVEGATPGTGSWQIIDRSRVPGDSPFRPDLDYCPQREEPMPVGEVAIETEGWRQIHARLAYRRAMSPTVGLIGPVDRLDHPDVGLYPNEFGQAPAWGVNEEQVVATVDGSFPGPGVVVAPWAGARRSLLHSAFADVAGGVDVAIGAHALSGELAYSQPIFDGDSIFAVFDPLPSIDARLAWSWSPKGARWRSRVEGWGRRYQTSDTTSTHAGGATASLDWRGPRVELGLDALGDAGWGGRRAGGTAHASWRASDWVVYQLRAGVLEIGDEPGRPVAPAAPDPRGVHGTLGVGGTWQVADGVGFHATAEAMTSRETRAQYRILAVLDLAFVPEM